MDEVRRKNLRIQYECDPSGDGNLLATPEDVVDENSLGRQIFQANFFGNRLSFTMGPVVLSHRYRWRRGRKRFKGRPYVFDLRATGGKFTLEPGETITVNTLEYLTLGRDLGALTLPRLSHATVGVVLSTSYVDPYWSGIMVFHIANTSPNPFTLRVGEKIGACHFYRVADTDLTTDFRDVFSAKSHHYGQSWRKILAEDADPFPQRKQADISNSRRQLAIAGEWLQRRWKSAFAIAGIGAIAGGLIVVGSYLKEIQEIRTLPAKLSTQEAEIGLQNSTIKRLRDHSPLAGQALISLPDGQSTSTTVERVAVPKGATPSLVLASPNPNVPTVAVSASMKLVSDEAIDVSVVAQRRIVDGNGFQQFPIAFVVFFS
ncbi:dCTP deaminase domain-containing protein [Mycobacterium sp. P7213]|uniref:dCTP deaminase domain-containing protein n=1 Tax=Mycobacterium sp. P7213 TaxID=2478465 RepID=UPI0013DDA6BE|nr:hypothetical protein [Mycobacterium sp. P7213]